MSGSRDCNDCSNLLRRDGTSQNQRFFEEQRTDYVQVDERSYIDLIQFVLSYSKKIQFWDVLNVRSGDWVAFVEKNQASLYAGLASIDLSIEQTKFDDIYSKSYDVGEEPQLELDVQSIFVQLSDLVFQLDTWLTLIDDDLELKDEIKNTIQRHGSRLVEAIIALDKGAYSEVWTGAVNPNLTISESDYSLLSDAWAIDPTDISSNNTAYTDGGGSVMDQLDHAKPDIRFQFLSLIDLLSKLKTDAKNGFNELLESYSKHEPHFALFLAFIQLFKHAQDHVNQFTDKHLNFYYRDVLRLEEKAADPDSVHLIFEPAKNIDQKKVEKGTTLKAGKDNNGVPIKFKTDDEIVINKGKVAKLKSIYLDRDKDSKYIQAIYKAEASNSADGEGKEFTEDKTDWEPFGKTQVKDGILLENRTMLAARSGFALASPELRLGDGERKVTITIGLNSGTFDNVFGASGTFKEFLDINESYYGTDFVNLATDNEKYSVLLSDWLLFRFTGVEGWVIPDNAALEEGEYPVNVLSGGGNTDLVFTLTLNRERDPITSYSSDIHGKKYTSNWPILEVLCDQSSKIGGVGIPKMAYEFLKSLKIEKVTYECEVEGMLNLKIANDSGGLDAGKPYHPFTTNPKVGSNFYIGSREVFSKRLTYMSIGLDWKGVPDAKFKNYYKAYKRGFDGSTPIEDEEFDLNGPNVDIQQVVKGNDHFTAHIKILDNFGWRDLSKASGTRNLHQSSGVALKQIRQVMILPLFFLVALIDMVKRIGNLLNGFSEMNDESYTNGGTFPYDGMDEYLQHDDRFLLVEPIQRNLTTYNYVNLFRYSSVEESEGNDARLPHVITVDSPDNGVPEDTTSGITNFGWLEPTGGDTKYFRDPYLGELKEYSEGTKRGYVKLELVNDFFHAAYGRYLTERASAPYWAPVGAPNKPYTPELQKTTLDYKSAHTVYYTGVDQISWRTRVEQFFHITPFGEVEVMPTNNEKTLDADVGEIYFSNLLVPNLEKTAAQITSTGRIESKVDPDTGRTVQINLEETSEGKLFIGIEDLDPPQSLSLLFQFKEGTEVNDLEVPAVEWSYLSENQWVSFESTEIIDDATHGLSNSGIIKFSMPVEATSENVILESGYHWIRASISGNTEAFSNLIDVHAQAVKATYVEDGNDPYRLNTEIQPSAISKLVNKDFEIKTIQQPYSSFDGRIEEQRSEYYARVAERLRHKQRGITIRDYEHIVLEEFPEIFKTKCINHTSKYSEYAPGSVSVIVIPYFKNQNERNPFELKVSKAKLSKIERFLGKLKSPFVDLDVRNPKYETIKVKFGVEFKLGYDRTYYENQLNQEIREFISPWAFGKDEDISFGAKLNRATILNFIEEREYVDYLTDFVMTHKENENKAPVEVYVAEGTTASSVLVTDLEHDINPVSCPTS